MNCTVCELSLNKAVIKQQTKGVQVAWLKLGKQILSQQKKKKPRRNNTYTYAIFKYLNAI